MLLTDYFRSEKDITWDYAVQCGVTHGVIRLPEDEQFDITDESHWLTVHKRFTDFGITPCVIEPMPNELHNSIKTAAPDRDSCIEKVIGMFPIMQKLNVSTICFNFMANIGWLRTNSHYPERGGAFVTEFNMSEFKEETNVITSDQLWDNYTYFIKAVIPEAEKYGIKLALHPDDPPVPSLSKTQRIFICKENIRKAVYDIVKSPSLGVTMCQATYHIMGEDLEKVITDFADKIYFVHFRNTTGRPEHFRETFHDNGDINMARIMRVYMENGIDVPIRVDHVPTMAGEDVNNPGYDAIGRLFAIGYLKGILDGLLN